MSPEIEAAIERHAHFLVRRLAIGFAHARVLAVMAFTVGPRRA